MAINVELLKRIKEHLIAEPKRYNQKVWGKDVRGMKSAPACGTQGCIAGWAVFLSYPKSKWRQLIKRDQEDCTFDISNEAKRLIGLDIGDADALFAIRNQSAWRGRKGVKQACLKIDDLIKRSEAAQ